MACRVSGQFLPFVLSGTVQKKYKLFYSVFHCLPEKDLFIVAGSETSGMWNVVW